MRIDSRSNPFDPAKPASAKVFVGRKDLLRQLQDGVANYLSYWLAGAQGMGKTSLLLALERSLLRRPRMPRAGSVTLPVYVDCPREGKTLEQFLVEIAACAAQALREKRGWPLAAHRED